MGVGMSRREASPGDKVNGALVESESFGGGSSKEHEARQDGTFTIITIVLVCVPALARGERGGELGKHLPPIPGPAAGRT